MYAPLPKAWVLAGLLICALFSADNSRADGWFYFDPIELEARIIFNASDQRVQNQAGLLSTDLNVGVSISQRGYILDPGIANFHLTIYPVYAWQSNEYNSGDPGTTATEHLDGRYTNYSFFTGLFRDMPIPVTASAHLSRNTGLTTGSLGSRFESTSTNNGASVQWEFEPFPMSLSYDEILTRQSSIHSFQNILIGRDDLYKLWVLGGRSSKTRLHMEHQDMDDRSANRNQDYTADIVSLDHRFPWGRESVLTSRLDYRDRSGFNGNKRLRIDELAQMYHTDNLSSQTRYGFSSTLQNVKTTSHQGEFRLTHSLYENMSNSVFLGGSYNQSSHSDETGWHTGLQSNYHKSNFFGLDAVDAGLGLTYRETDRNSSQQLVEIIEEAHAVALSGDVILARLFILAPTIIVTNANSTLAYAEGFDYTVAGITANLTQIRVLAGGRINTGDTILVSYQALASPSQASAATTTNFNLRLLKKWFAFAHSHSQTNNKLLAGVDANFIREYRYDTTSIEAAWKMAAVDARVGAFRNFTKIDDYEGTTFTFNEQINWSLFDATRWGLNASQSISDAGNRHSEVYSLSLSAGWNPIPSLSLQSVVSAWKSIEEYNPGDGEKPDGSFGNRDNSFLHFGLGMRWQYQKLDMIFDYQHNRWIYEIVQQGYRYQNVENRLMISLSRRFY